MNSDGSSLPRMRVADAPGGTTVMVTFIFVVAVAAFIPYVATPAIVNGVKAISAPPATMPLEPSPAVSERGSVRGSDAANRIVSERRDREAAV
jgi:hypothetical protein